MRKYIVDIVHIVPFKIKIAKTLQSKLIFIMSSVIVFLGV